MRLISIFQILMTVISLGILSSVWLKFMRREQRQTIFKLSINNIVWISVLLFSLFPDKTHDISEKLGFGESLNTFIFIGFLLVFIIFFKLINVIERLERNISEIVRKEALSKIEKCK